MENTTEKTPEQIEREKAVLAENDSLVEFLRNAAYPLISSWTARKAFKTAIKELKYDGSESLVEKFAREAQEIRTNERAKLMERLNED